MPNYLSQLDKDILKLIKAIGQQADQLQIPAYLVGGIVRDGILRKLNLDIDIVVEGEALVLAEAIAKKYKVKVTPYAVFNTATVSLTNGLRLDFASSRKELYPSPGALPEVSSGDLKDDLFRRDFTINALAISINQKSFGQLVDLFGGINDLRAQKIRVLHPISFQDDPTRILRAIRFEQRFQFRLEEQTLLLLKKAIEEKYFESVKAPRYFAEFRKMLAEENGVLCLKRLEHLGALSFIHENLKIDHVALLTTNQEFVRFKQTQKYEQENAGFIYFLVLLEKLDDAQTSFVAERFNLTKDEKLSITQSREHKRFYDNLILDRLKASKVYQLFKPLSLTTLLYLRCRFAHPKLRQRIDQFLSQDRQIETAINGNDLQTLGVIPGQRIGVILEEILYQKIDGKIKTKAQELKLAKQMIKDG